MKKRLLMGVLLGSALFFHRQAFGQEKPPQSLDLTFVMYDANIFYPAFDLELGVPFWKRGGNSFAFLSTFLFYIPSSSSFPQPVSLLFGWIPQIQYRYQKKGFHFTLETGLGAAGDFKTVEVFTVAQGFHRSAEGTPYGVFSLTTRLGYEFGYKYKQPFHLAFILGYRLQFPYNLTVNHIILFGVSFGYSFGLKSAKKGA